jgi:hypothetical protein
VTERRREPRERLLIDVVVACRDTDEALGSLVDLTRSGLMLLGSRRIVPGRHFRMELRLPAALDGRDWVHVEADSLWTCRQPTSTRRLTGFGHLDAAPADLNRIDRLLEEYGAGSLPFAGSDVMGLSR